MLAPRKVALRVNGVLVTTARVCRGERGLELIITDPLLGDVAIDDSSEVELLELLFPPAMRERLPNGGLRKVSVRVLIALLRHREVVLVRDENEWKS
jgi:hypothetical protein